MEAIKPGLELCSSTKELSRVAGASSNEQTKNKNNIRIDNQSHNCTLEMASRKKGAKIVMNKSPEQGCSSSRKVNLSKSKGKAVLCSEEIGKLHERMRILEEETESMEKELLEGAEERSKLINQIHQQFKKREFRTHATIESSSRFVDEQDEKAGMYLSEDLQQELAQTMSLLMLTQ